MDYEGRRANLLSLMERERIDVLIISHLPNVRYLTGFTGSAGIAAVGGDDLFLVTDFRYESQATLECGERARVEIVPADPVARLWELLSRRGAATVGFEGDRITAREAHRFTEFAVNIRIEDAGGLVERLRARKEPDEVERVKQAARLATEALGIAVDSVQVGSTEVAVAATLEGELRRRGSEWHPFETIVASGARSALPHARTSCKTIAAGDLLLFDFGAMVDGYCCDISRTFVVGREPDERQRNVYEVVRGAQDQARRSIAAGMTGRDADGIARSVINQRGYGAAFGHSLGHGLGLEVHEAPRLSKANDDPIPERAVVTIEPGIYIAGWGGVRIEDDVYLGSDGTQLLTDFPTDLTVIG